MGIASTKEFMPVLKMAVKKFETWRPVIRLQSREEEACHIFMEILQESASTHFLGLPEGEFAEVARVIAEIALIQRPRDVSLQRNKLIESLKGVQKWT